MNRLVLFFIILGFASPSWSQFMGPNWGKNNRTQIPSIRNPQISAGTVFLGGYSTQNTDHSDETEDEHAAHSGLQTGLQVQEIEIRFMSNVDPFFRLELGLTGHTHEGVMELGFEEAFLTTIAIPDLTLRAGQFMMNFGKANLMHVHARHFIEAPLLLTELLGSEHLIGTGVSADNLAPLPFFTELNLQAVKANWKSGAHAHGASPDETHQEDAFDLSYLAHLKTFFEMGDANTLELGGSYLATKDDHGHWNNAWGTDITFKWVPIITGRYTSFEWNTEYISSQPDEGDRDGLYSSVRYQIWQQWWAQLRAARIGVFQPESNRRYRGEALIAFAPSERSVIRLQYGAGGSLDAFTGNDHDHEHEHDHTVPEPSLTHDIFLQFVTSIGAHPAHAY